MCLVLEIFIIEEGNGISHFHHAFRSYNLKISLENHHNERSGVGTGTSLDETQINY